MVKGSGLWFRFFGLLVRAPGFGVSNIGFRVASLRFNFWNQGFRF